MDIATKSTPIASTLLVTAFIAVVLYPTFVLMASEASVAILVFMFFFRASLYFHLFHVTGYWLYRCLSRSYSFPKYDDLPPTLPSVAVLVPFRNEPYEVIDRMIFNLARVSYSNLIIILVDNSTQADTEKMLSSALKHHVKVEIVRKGDTRGYKAGALNSALSHIPESVKYILVMDSDHAPKPLILEELVPVLEANDDISFVQAPQVYEVTKPTLVSSAYCYKQRIFYDQICPGMAANNVLFLTGSNFIIRRSLLHEVGGFDDSSLTEDVRTSVHIHQSRHKGLFYPGTVAIGFAPKDLRSYQRQQRRWAIGTFQNFFYMLRLLLRNPCALTFDQWMLYVGWNGSFYFQGICNLFLAWSSLVLLYAGVRRFFVFTDAIPFIALILTLLSQMLWERRNAGTKWSIIMLSKALFFGDSAVFFGAFIDLLLRRNLTFEVTSKTSSLTTGYTKGFIVYHLLFAVSVLTAAGTAFALQSFDPALSVWPLLFLLQTVAVLFIALAGKKQAGVY